MAHKFIPQLITANDLLEGDAIYFTKDDDWSREYSDSVIAQDAEQSPMLPANSFTASLFEPRKTISGMIQPNSTSSPAWLHRLI